MCNFFSVITLKGEYYYFNWKQRQERNFDDCDSHSEIAKFYDLKDERINCYEYNPLTKHLVIDAQHGPDDSKAVQEWCDGLDWKTIVEPLIVKPIINPLELPIVESPTEEQIEWLKRWASVWDSVWDSVRASVWASVRDSVGASVWDSVGASVWDSVWASVWDSVWDSVRDSVWDSVGDSVWDSVWASVGASVWAYISSFFDIGYKLDFSPAVKLWEAGLVPSFDGTTWRLHSGKDAKIVYEWRPE